MKQKKLITLILACGLLLSACTTTPKKPNGTTNEEEQQQNNDNTQIDKLTEDEKYKIYQLAVGSGYTGTYEEWLNSIKGEKGNPGQDGQDGYSLLTGRGAPEASLGKTGDSYLDLECWDFYVKEASGWKLVGNIKGESGDNTDYQGLAFYYLDNGTYGVGVGTATYLSRIVIPSFHNGKAVTKVVNNGFASCAATYISLPKSITSIGAGGFHKYSELTLQYSGTFTEFKAISFGDNWINSQKNITADLKFICSDVTVNFDDLFDQAIIKNGDNELSKTINLYESSASIYFSHTFKTNAFGGYSRGQEVIDDVELISSNEEVVSFIRGDYQKDLYSRIVPVGKGEATITIKYHNAIFTANVVVKQEEHLSVAQAKAIANTLNYDQESSVPYVVTGYITKVEQQSTTYVYFEIGDASDSTWEDSFYVYYDASAFGVLSFALSVGMKVEIGGTITRWETGTWDWSGSTSTFIPDGGYRFGSYKTTSIKLVNNGGSEITVPESLANKDLVFYNSPTSVSIILWQWDSQNSGWKDFQRSGSWIGVDLDYSSYLITEFNSGVTASTAKWPDLNSANGFIRQTYDYSYIGTSAVLDYNSLLFKTN